MRKLTLYREETTKGYRWYIDAEGGKHLVTVDIKGNGWAMVPESCMEYNSLIVTSFGVAYHIATQGKELSYIETVTDLTRPTHVDNRPVDKFVISEGHPAAMFFNMTRINDDGSSTVTCINHIFDKQPY